MEAVAKILSASRAELLPVERVGAISSIDPGSERICPICNGAGWLGVGKRDVPAYAPCKCRIERLRSKCLSLIPERFKDSSFATYRPHNHLQERALAMMRGDLTGSWYLTGAYGNTEDPPALCAVSCAGFDRQDSLPRADDPQSG